MATGASCGRFPDKQGNNSSCYRQQPYQYCIHKPQVNCCGAAIAVNSAGIDRGARGARGACGNGPCSDSTGGYGAPGTISVIGTI